MYLRLLLFALAGSVRRNWKRFYVVLLLFVVVVFVWYLNVAACPSAVNVTMHSYEGTLAMRYHQMSSGNRFSRLPNEAALVSGARLEHAILIDWPFHSDSFFLFIHLFIYVLHQSNSSCCYGVFF